MEGVVGQQTARVGVEGSLQPRLASVAGEQASPTSASGGGKHEEGGIGNPQGRGSYSSVAPFLGSAGNTAMNRIRQALGFIKSGWIPEGDRT